LIIKKEFEDFDEISGMIPTVTFCFFRLITFVINELIIYKLILSYNLGDEGGSGLIVNFAAAMIVA
jgi:hypothetical protein